MPCYADVATRFAFPIIRQMRGQFEAARALA